MDKDLRELETVSELDDLRDTPSSDTLQSEDVYTEPMVFNVDITRGYLYSNPKVAPVCRAAALCRDYTGKVQFRHKGKSYDPVFVGTILDSEFMNAKEFQCTIKYDPFDSSSYHAAKTLKMRIECAFKGNPNIPLHERRKHLF
jgi:hypothetical protein